MAEGVTAVPATGRKGPPPAHTWAREHNPPIGVMPSNLQLARQRLIAYKPDSVTRERLQDDARQYLQTVS